MIKQKTTSLIAMLASSLLLVACGSDSDDDSANLTGTFIDSAVANIAYRTETLSGFTNEAGEFDYLKGETVVFSVGGIDFPSGPASGVVTPLTLADTLDISNTTVSNIIRLLQSLDVDGDASNGISISDTAHTAAADMGDVDVTSDTFSADQDVINLIANSGSTTTQLISAFDASNHFEDTLGTLFSEYSISGNTFSISSDDTEATELIFNANGTGSIEFAVNDVNSITWSVAGDVLSFKEVDDYQDYWDWVYTVTSVTATQIEVSFSVTGMEDGQAVSDSGVLTMDLEVIL